MNNVLRWTTAPGPLTKAALAQPRSKLRARNWGPSSSFGLSSRRSCYPDRAGEDVKSVFATSPCVTPRLDHNTVLQMPAGTAHAKERGTTVARCSQSTLTWVKF